MNLEQQLEQHKERYKNNLHFRRFVLMVYPLLRDGEVTAGELRDAVTFTGQMLKIRKRLYGAEG